MTEETLGRYRLTRKLATGGMAEIWLAEADGPEGFRKQLVVKRILPGLAEDPEFVRMFLDEARIAARLNHPNIGQIFELGEADGSFFLAMEYIPGRDLRRIFQDAVKAKTPLPIPLAVRVIIEAAQALDYAHGSADEAGQPLHLVHRDVSPQNILVTFRGGVKLVDFGIAKAADQASHTRVGVLKGKYSYMSPEQASGGALDARSDLFSLGVVAYELVTGYRLFKRDNELATLQAVQECQVDPPSQVSPQVPRSLDRILLKTLSREPAERYRTAGQLALALEEFLLLGQYAASGTHLAEFMRRLYPDLGEVAMEPRPPPRPGSQPSQPSPSGSSTNRRLAVHDPAAPPRKARTTERPSERSKLQTAALVPALPTPPPPPASPRPKPKAASRVVVAGAKVASEPEPEQVPAPEVVLVPTPAAPPTRRLPSPRALAQLFGAGMLILAGLWAMGNAGGIRRWLAESPTEAPASAATLAPTADGGAPCLLCGLIPNREGMLTVVTRPAATVYLGGEALGETPLVERTVPAGTLELRLINDSAALDTTVEVAVRPEQRASVHREFAQGTVAVPIPKGHAYHVYFHQKPLGQLPGPPIQLVEGSHTLILVDDATGERVERTVTVAASKRGATH